MKLPVKILILSLCAGLFTAQAKELGFSTPAEKGMNPSLTQKLDSIVIEAIDMGAFPGCQLLVAKDGDIVHYKSYGFLTKDGNPVTDSTIYDLASVSKTLGTLPGIMKLYDQGKLDINDKISKYIPQLVGTDKEDITIEQLLYHESGMPAALNMFKVALDPATPDRLRQDIFSFQKSEEFPIEAAKGIFVGKAAYDTIMSNIYNIPLRKTKDYNYSCLNFCLLMNIEENITGIPHNQFVHDSIYAPLGAGSTTYRPLETNSLSNIAPTEIDSVLRHQLVHGYVHDETANFSGGVQGNAGLFSNALDLAKICQMWLNGGVYGNKRLLSEETVELFTTAKSPTCRRGLGFDKPDMENPENSPTCEEANASVYGHTGFTGTIFWVDPENELIFIFLTNRVNPSRITPAFAKSNVRPALFREVLNSLKKEEIQDSVIVGAARTREYLPLLKGKKVALFSNHTGMVGNKHTLDIMLENGIDVVTIFSPEHGFRGNADAGEHVASSVDEKTGIPISSLYDVKKEGASDSIMNMIDVVVTDIQDVGLRYYTYYCSMLDLMNAAKKYDKEFIVLDRPNPNGMYVDGPVLDMKYRSGVGRLPIPVVYGLTLGELAQMTNGEGWLENGDTVDLTVIPCENYTHQTRYELPIAPSPNLRSMKAVYLYPSTCYFEATPVSLGRGTDFPFLVYGHPDMKGYDFEFTPRSTFGAKNPPQENKLCYGVSLMEIPDETAVSQGVNLEYLIDAYNALNMGDDFFTKFFELLIGRSDIRGMIEQGMSAQEIKKTWADDVTAFLKQRKPYLIYPE